MTHGVLFNICLCMEQFATDNCRMYFAKAKIAKLCSTSNWIAHVEGRTMPSPVQLGSKVLSPSTVWLEWKDPTLGRVQQLTDSRYYNVHYRPLMMPAASDPTGTRGGAAGHSPAAGRTLSVVVKATHIVFYDLRPGTRYEFKVRTVKDAVASVFSETIVNKTFETGNKFQYGSLLTVNIQQQPRVAVGPENGGDIGVADILR